MFRLPSVAIFKEHPYANTHTDLLYILSIINGKSLFAIKTKTNLLHPDILKSENS
jgi:hypothetical protein